MYQLDKIVPHETRLRLLAGSPHLIGFCEYDLVKEYYNLKAKDLNPKELEKFQKKLLHDCAQAYRKYLELFFKGEPEFEINPDLIHTNKGSITEDEMVDLITSGVKIEVLDEFNLEDLNIIGTYYRQYGDEILYQYQGQNYSLLLGYPDHIASKVDDISNYPTPNIKASEANIYTLVKMSEVAKIKDEIKLLRTDKESSHEILKKI